MNEIANQVPERFQRVSQVIMWTLEMRKLEAEIYSKPTAMVVEDDINILERKPSNINPLMKTKISDQNDPNAVNELVERSSADDK